MMTGKLYITLFFFLFFLLSSGCMDRAVADSDIHYELLLDLINQARENPLNLARQLGMDTEEILLTFPEMKDNFTYGLSPLSWNDSLHLSASLHTQEMIHDNYYSLIGRNGSTVNNRIEAQGYDSLRCGETLGMVAFTNYLSPDEAVWILFEQMFRDELNHKSSQQNILNPEFQEVGIGLETGIWVVDGNIQNVYVVTCDFATPTPSEAETGQIIEVSNHSANGTLSTVELGIVEYVNQLRRDPLRAAASLGIEMSHISRDNAEYSAPEKDMSPVVFNESLYQAAKAHATDMIQNDYYSDISVDGKDVADRVAAAGYPSDRLAGENIRLLSSVDFIPLNQAAKINIEKIFKRELLSAPQERHLLNPEMQDVGVYFLFLPPQIWKGAYTTYSNYFTYLLITTFGGGSYKHPPYICGTVYQDANKSGLFEIGEGISELPVFIENSEITFRTKTNEAGGFAVLLPPDIYRIGILVNGKIRLRKWVEATGRNKGFPLNFE